VTMGSLPKDVTVVFFANLVLLILCALICGFIAARAGLPKMVGELAAGVLLGPTVFGQIAPGAHHALFPAKGTSFELISGISQLAVVLLVGVVGMHVDVDKLRQRLAGIAAISALGLAIPLAGGVAVGLVLPEPLKPHAVDRTTFALFLGIAISVSAIPVIARILMDLGLTSHEIAQLILAAAIVDDVAGWVLLSVVTGIATDEGTHPGTFAKLGAAAVVVMLLIAMLGRERIRRRIVARCANLHGSTITAVALVTIILFATGGQLLGLEPVIGAFIAGIVIISATPRGSSVHRPLHVMVMGFFSPIFFAAVGLQLNLSMLLTVPVAVSTIAICGVAVASKFAGAGLGAKLSGFSWRESTAIGAGLNTRGVIQIVIAMVGVRCGVFGTEVFTALVVTTIVTTVVAGPVLRRTLKVHTPQGASAPGSPAALAETPLPPLAHIPSQTLSS
jgi:Kef-type K+ transport system membrane component KefB